MGDHLKSMPGPIDRIRKGQEIPYCVDVGMVFKMGPRYRRRSTPPRPVSFHSFPALGIIEQRIGTPARLEGLQLTMDNIYISLEDTLQLSLTSNLVCVISHFKLVLKTCNCSLKTTVCIGRIYLYTNTVLDGSVTLSVTLSVRYRNHFRVVQFQN